MAKKSSSSDRAERRQERRSGSDNTPYKMRSAASRRAEARARAGTLEGAAEVAVGGIAAKDVGIRVNPNATARARRKYDDLSPTYVSRLLHAPTIEITDQMMQDQYGYVVHDIRGMMILAAGMFALLIFLAFVLPR